jgi:hypothetical protein
MTSAQVGSGVEPGVTPGHRAVDKLAEALGMAEQS